MISLDAYEILFITAGFLFQLILIIHFSLRRWLFDLAMRCGRIVYAMTIPATAISIIILMGGKSWVFWLGGFLYLAWAIYGYTVEYIKQIEWRLPIRWSILGLYLSLYLAAIMFYWWPLALIYKPLWYIYAVLFITNTMLNLSSHKKNEHFVLKEVRR